MIEDGIIELDTERGQVFGLTSANFETGTYFWKVGNAVYVSFVASNIKGAFRATVSKILDSGLTIKIPTPLARMGEIVRKNGYRHTVERFLEIGEDCDVWVLEPPKTVNNQQRAP